MPHHNGNASAYYGLPTAREEAEEARGDCPTCGANMDGQDPCPECGEDAPRCYGCDGLASDGDHSRCHLIP